MPKFAIQKPNKNMMPYFEKGIEDAAFNYELKRKLAQEGREKEYRKLKRQKVKDLKGAAQKHYDKAYVWEYNRKLREEYDQ